MASNQRKLTQVYLKDVETDRLYEITVTLAEKKRLETDIAYATLKLNEIKKHEANKVINVTLNHETEEILQEEDILQEISQKETQSTNEEVGNNLIQRSTNEEVGDSLTQGTNEEFGGFKWPHEAILLLIEEYTIRQNDFSSGKMSQKKIWSLIADELIKNGNNVTGPQCLSKFSGLKRTYKAVKDHNNKSGNGTRTWPYFSHMDNLLGSKPFMSPVSTISSTGKRSQSPSESSTSSDSCLDTEQKSTHKKVRQSYNLENLVEEFKENRKTTENCMERRHQENIQMRKQFLETFEKMINILSKK